MLSSQRIKTTEHELVGLDEIRKAMAEVEDLRRNGINARIEVEDKIGKSSIKVLLYSSDELQVFISHRFSRMLVNGITTSIPLDDFERIVSEVSTRLVDDSNSITGRLIM